MIQNKFCSQNSFPWNNLICKNYKKNCPCSKEWYADPPFLSEVPIFTWKMLTALNGMKNNVFDFSFCLFFRYGHQIVTIWLKKSFRSSQIYKEDANLFDNDFLARKFFCGKKKSEESLNILFISWIGHSIPL